MMKKLIWMLAICIVGIIVVIGLVGCKGPAGPTGPKGDTGDAGKDGKDGLNAGFVYFEGFKDSLRCATCHDANDTTYYMAGVVEQWKESVHGSGTAFEENRVNCVECHSTEGFIKKSRGETIASDIMNVTPPGCFACHSPHKNGDFALRTTTAAQQSLPSNITGVPAYTFNGGKGNLCVACHRPRTISVSANNMLPDPTKTTTADTLKINTSRWYGHYGVQGQILKGVGAFQWTDAATYTSTTAHSANAPISTEGCAACHMADYRPANAYGGRIGGHTMHMKYTPEGSTTAVELIMPCKTCHGSLTKLDYNNKITDFDKNMDTLKNLLVAKNWIDTLNNIKASSSSVLKIVPASRGGALFNYMMLLHDGSHGIHNPAYANSIVRASIAELRKP